jgi:phytoene/squalene synthetase
MVCGEERTESLFTLSDRICTALQLTNHWQDVKRDMLERNRLYIPREMIDVPGFELRLIASAKQGWAVDHQFLEQSRTIIRKCVMKTWPLFEEGLALLDHVGERTRPIVWLFASGGQHVLHKIELWGFETALHRPTLSKLRKLALVMQAWIGAKRERRKAVGS